MGILSGTNFWVPIPLRRSIEAYCWLTAMEMYCTNNITNNGFHDNGITWKNGGNIGSVHPTQFKNLDHCLYDIEIALYLERKLVLKSVHYLHNDSNNYCIFGTRWLMDGHVVFDSSLNFRKHISQTCTAFFYHIRDLRRIRISLSLDLVKQITVASSKLDYCN